jgi:signal transduction histidine kinase
MTDNTFNFVSAKGEMADLVRTKDWENTSVGNPDSWPSSLRTTLSIILNSNFPMFLFWGKDLVCFYNDAYRPSLGEDGKHPTMLGTTAKESWEEVYDFVLDVTSRVFATGEAEMFYDNLIPIYRNGQMENVYWTFCYSAIKNESGETMGILITCMETTSQIKAVRKLEESKVELQFAVESAELGTFDYDPKTESFTSNERLKSWYGLGDDKKNHLQEVLGKIHKRDRDYVTSAVQNTVDSEKRSPFDIIFTIVNSKTSKEMIVRARGKSTFNEDEPMAANLNGILQDITEQKKFTNELERQIRVRTRKLDEANEALEEKNLILEQRNKELQSFSYISSHDLQEPLRKIQTFSTRILEKEYENLSEKGKNYFNRMRSSANRMQSLIQDLLSYSKIDHNKNEFTKISINQVIDEVKEELFEELQDQESTIVVNSSEEVTVIRFQFFQLFYNLFTNSLKFAKKDVLSKITVNCELITWDTTDDNLLKEGKLYCQIEVQDNGIGFEPEQNKLIFELFQRLHGMSKFEGTGIGLAIVKKIVENHNGKIEAFGVPSEGAKFVIYVPA